MMVDGDLHQAGTVLLAQHRDETVHLAIQGQSFGQVAAQSPQGTAHVQKSYAGDLANQPVADPRRNLTQEEMVLTAGPQAQDGIVTLLQLVQQTSDVGRVVLEVAVHGDQHLAARPVNAGLQGRRLAEVAPQPDHLDPGVRGRQLLQNGKGTVHTAVVHEDDLVGYREGIDGPADALMQRLYVLPLVLDRNDHRQLRHGLAPRTEDNGRRGRRTRPTGLPL